MKLERLAGIAGTPETEHGFGRDWFVCQYSGDNGQIYAPVRDTEQAAIRAWNAMVRRIRKANAEEEKP